MSNLATHTRTDNALLAMAADVTASLPCAYRPGNPRDAARAMMGIAAWVLNRIGLDAMQSRMGEIARHDPAWTGTAFMRSLPTGPDGRVDEYIAMIATVAAPLIAMHGATNLRSAMAWWATERDAAAWQAIAG